MYHFVVCHRKLEKQNFRKFLHSAYIINNNTYRLKFRCVTERAKKKQKIPVGLLWVISLADKD